MPEAPCLATSGAHIGSLGPSDLKLLARTVKNKAERQIIAGVLLETHEKRTVAARLLNVNISRKSLYGKIRTHGLDEIELPTGVRLETEDRPNASLGERI